VSDNYKKSLELAGANILEFERFGRHGWRWAAKIECDGIAGWVIGSEGTCSCCDAFLSEFEFSTHGCYPCPDQCDDYYSPISNNWDFRDGCKECQYMKSKIAEFGKRYIGHVLSQEYAEAVTKEDADWCDDAQEMLDFIMEHNGRDA
jgi:hypothetical protein